MLRPKPTPKQTFFSDFYKTENPPPPDQPTKEVKKMPTKNPILEINGTEYANIILSAGRKAQCDGRMVWSVIEKACAVYGRKPFTEQSFNINIVGLRLLNRVDNSFSDFILVGFRSTTNGPLVGMAYKATTVPGRTYLLNPSRKSGCAVLKPGFYKGCWKIDIHNNKYEALCQRLGQVTVYRDNDRDTMPEETSVEETGMFGINFHHHGGGLDEATNINNASAGCQVFAEKSSFDLFMGDIRFSTKIDRGAGKKWESFSYLLVNTVVK